MKKFKLYGYEGNNLVLITNSNNISPASTYEENINIQRHSKASLNFKINDKITTTQLNPFINLIYSGARLRLILENEIDSNLNTVIEFIIKSIENEFYKDMIIYSVSAEDLASITYAKTGINLNIAKTGTLEELVKEILAETRANPSYTKASYNYISTTKYKSIINSTMVDGVLKSTTISNNNPAQIIFNKDQVLKTNDNYHLYFYFINADQNINLRISQYNNFGLLIEDTEEIYEDIQMGQLAFVFTPKETMAYFSLSFESSSLTSLIISDLKLYRDLDNTVNNYLHLSSNFNPENFKAETDENSPISYSYYKKVTLSLSNSNLYNALIELCNLFDAVLETEYNVDSPNTFNFIPRTSNIYKGYRLSPDFNLSSISRSEDFSDFITSLHIKGAETNTSIYPEMPEEFLSYFNNCIESTDEAISNPFLFASNDFNLYGSQVNQLLYSDIANIILDSLSEADKFEREDIIYAYAYACDKVPNFENVIYNINYFYKIGKISLEDYTIFINKIYNDLRILNIKIKIFSSQYYNALTDFINLDNSINFNCQTISVENLNKYDLNKLLTETYEYDHLQTKLVGDNLLRNSDFKSYGQNNNESETYNIPSYWTMSSAALSNKPFIINKDFLTDEGSNSLKFQDITSLDPVEDLKIFLDDYNNIKLTNVGSSTYVTLTAYIYLDNNFANYFPKLELICYPNGYYTTTLDSFSNLYDGNNLIKNKWIRVEYKIPDPIPSETTDIQFVISVITPNQSTRSSATSIFYIAQPQLELRNFATDWSSDIIAEAGSIGVNLLPNTIFNQDDNTTPNGWNNKDNGTFTIASNYLVSDNVTQSIIHDGKKVLKFNYSSSLSNETYIAADFIDIKAYELNSRSITFSGYIYKPLSFYLPSSTTNPVTATLTNPLYLMIKTYNSNKEFISTIDLEFINDNNIGSTDTWINFKRTFTIPDKSEIKYIKPFIGYYKLKDSPGKNTDLVFLSLLQLEFGSRASSWTAQYDIDGKRYKTYKFILDGHKFINNNKVTLSYYNDDQYINSYDLYPAKNDDYYIVQADSNSFKLSTTPNGNPIKYNEVFNPVNSDKWKLSSLNLQYKTPEWISIKNSIADREDTIEKSTLENFKLMDIIYNEYYQPIRVALENNNIRKIKIDSFLDKLFTLYGYENNFNNGLQIKISELEELIKTEKNNYDKNKQLILDLVIALNDDNLTSYDRNLKETKKAGYILENDNSKFTIGIFNEESKIVDNNNKTILIYLPSSAVENRYKTIVIPEIFDITNFNLIGKYVRIVSLDNQEQYTKYIIAQEDNELTIEYFPKAEKAYNIFIIERNEDFNNPLVLGQYQTKLYFYNLLKQFLNSYTYQNSYLDYSKWGLRYNIINLGNNNQDISAKITDYLDYTTAANTEDIIGSAVITYQDYGDNHYDYMIKLSPFTTLLSYFSIPSDQTLDIKVLIKYMDTIIDGDFSITIIKQDGLTTDWSMDPKPYYTNNWDIITNTTTLLTAGDYIINFINNSNYNIYLYRPAAITHGALLSNEQLYALYDNPQTKDYIETITVDIGNKIGLYNIIENTNSDYNLIKIKNAFLGNLYNDYKNFLFEGYYENTEEIDSFGLLEQALINSEKFRIPKIVYNTSIIDLSALQNYNYLNVKVGDKIIIAEPSDRLYRSYIDEDNKELLIANITYDLRNMGSTSLTVERDNETKILIQKLLKNIT